MVLPSGGRAADRRTQPLGPVNRVTRPKVRYCERKCTDKIVRTAPGRAVPDGTANVSVGRRPAAYRELADQLRQRILQSEGGRLPTEAELTQEYRVSRHTVRRAYQELVAEGVVRRTPGRGTFPAPPGQYVRSFGSLEDLIAQSEDTEMEVLRPLAPVSAPDDEVRSRLMARQVMELRIRRLNSGLPFSQTTALFPLPVGRKLERFDWLRGTGARHHATVLALLDQVLFRSPAVAEQVITVAPVPADVAVQIDCEPGQQVLRIDRLFLDRDDRPIELAINYFNPERYSYRMMMTRTLKD
jgi:GntR family transcriptional regulator